MVDGVVEEKADGDGGGGGESSCVSADDGRLRTRKWR